MLVCYYKRYVFSLFLGLKARATGDNILFYHVWNQSARSTLMLAISILYFLPKLPVGLVVLTISDFRFLLF
jgi:hypothetical protein